MDAAPAQCRHSRNQGALDVHAGSRVHAPLGAGMRLLDGIGVPKNNNQQFEFDFSPIQDVEAFGEIWKKRVAWEAEQDEKREEERRMHLRQASHQNHLGFEGLSFSDWDPGQKFMRNPKRGVE